MFLEESKWLAAKVEHKLKNCIIKNLNEGQESREIAWIFKLQ